MLFAEKTHLRREHAGIGMRLGCGKQRRKPPRPRRRIIVQRRHIRRMRLLKSQVDCGSKADVPTRLEDRKTAPVCPARTHQPLAAIVYDYDFEVPARLPVEGVETLPQPSDCRKSGNHNGYRWVRQIPILAG